ncbi:unnamed protein product [Prorocentrum cordatum]|uniref:Phospholipase B-like n=1 Tax=Prorocentrum cordatum TaxID=2364126 RepID=A0ABN9UAS2_9DINO|nr:unnamed protein product [Polarella glacialis]
MLSAPLRPRLAGDVSVFSRHGLETGSGWGMAWPPNTDCPGSADGTRPLVAPPSDVERGGAWLASSLRSGSPLSSPVTVGRGRLHGAAAAWQAAASAADCTSFSSPVGLRHMPIDFG